MAPSEKPAEQLAQDLAAAKREAAALRHAKSAEVEAWVALREVTSRLTEILENTPNAVVIVDREWAITYFNRISEAIANRRRQEVLGKNLWGVFAQTLGEPQVRTVLEQAARDRKPASFELRSKRTGQWLVGHASPYLDGLICFGQDITEQKRAEEALRQGEERFRLLAETAGDMVYLYQLAEPQGYQYVNPACEAIFGYPPEAFYADPNFSLKLVHPDDRAQLETLQRQKGPLDLARRIRWITKDGRTIWCEAQRKPVLDAAGAMVAVQGIIRDVTKQVEAEGALRQSEERFRLLAENARDLVYRYRRTEPRGYEFISPSVQRLLGYTPEEVYATPQGPRFVHLEDRHLLPDLDRGATAFIPQQTLRFLTKAGRTIWMEISRSATYDAQGRIIAVEGIARDITERKRAEAALAESEERFRLLAENARDVLFRYRFKEPRGFEYISPAVERITGYTAEEMLADPDIGDRIVHPEDLEQLKRSRGMRNGDPQSALEFYERPQVMRWIAKDGRSVWVELIHSLVRNEQGELVAVNGITRDITERKRAEKALADSEERFRLLAETAQDIVYRFHMHPQFGVDYLSPSAKAVMGYAPGELYRDPNILWAVIHPEDRDAMRQLFKEPQLAPPQFSIRYMHKDGTVRWFEHQRVFSYGEGGRVVAIQGTARDITARRQAEDALRKSEERFRLLAEHAQDMIYRYRLTEPRGFEYVSPAFERITGYPVERFLKDPTLGARLVHPDDIHIRQAIRQEPESLTGRFTARWITADGRVLWTEHNRVVFRDSRGAPVAVQGVVRDITERVQAQRALEEANKRLVETLENSHDGFLSVDGQWRITYFNRQAERYAAMSRQDVLGKVLWDVFAKETFPASAKEDLLRAMRERASISSQSFYEPLNAWIELQSYPTSEGMAFFFRDITHRLQAEEAVRKSEERFRLMAENARDMIYIFRFKPQRGFEYISPACADLTGYTPEEFYASPGLFLERMHQDDRAATQAALESPQKSVVPIVTRWVHKDGCIRWLECQKTPIFDERGEFVAIEAITRDITEAKGAEEELRETNRRLQRSARRVVQAQEDVRRMVSERLHAQVQNRLVVADQHIQLALEALGAEHPAAEHLSRANAIVTNVISEDLRTITRQLHPSMIRVGLLPALRSMADSSFKNIDVDIQFQALSPEMRSITGTGLDEGLRLAIFRVAEEALTNVQKHAQAKHVEVLVDTPTREAISLTVRDDGVGFDPSEHAAGLGIYSMQDYCASRGGTLRIESAPGKGTAVVAQFPIQWRPAPEPPLSEPPRAPAAPGAVRRVLIADDMRELCGLLRETFVPADGFEVIGEAHDGQEAVTLARQLVPPPDVVILDIDMPRLTGPEAAQMIRKGLPGACIFLMSAFDQGEFSEVAKSVGANGYIPKKTLTPEYVAQAIQNQATP